jgi:predicted ATPase/DNA-binding CsgD family transcriptional regulator
MDTTNLPLQLTNFIGRKRELAEVEALLSTAHLVTLTGTGGCGKTRLALKVAEAAGRSFRDGVWFVELESLDDPTLVSQLINQTLGVPHQSANPPIESLIRFLQPKSMLVILDNCEHLIASCARIAQQILAQCAHVRLLATSREPLAIAGEEIYPLNGLASPSPQTASRGNLQDLSSYDSVRLFVERAQAVLPQFELTTGNAASIIRICRRLDGLPLALELSAARCKLLTPQEIAKHLDHRFRLLVSNQRGEVNRRHRSLRAALKWSYDLLAPQERLLLQRLSVFAGGCSFASLQTVCGGDDLEPAQTLDLLSSLVNQSLVTVQTLQRSQARYHLLETIRQYAREKLAAGGSEAVMRDRHLNHFLALVEQVAPKLNEKEQGHWFDRLADEYRNIRAALSWSLESGNIETGLRIANAIYPFWTVRDYFEEALAWLERLLAQSNVGIPMLLRVNALTNAAYLAGFQGKAAKQMALGREAELLAQKAGEQGKQALVLAIAVQVHAARLAGDEQTEQAVTMRVVELIHTIDDKRLLATAAIPLSLTLMSIGRFDEAHTILEESLSEFRAKDDYYKCAMILNFSGDLARCERNYPEAKNAYEESFSLLRELNAERDVASVLHNLGYTYLHLGDFERARGLFQMSLKMHQEQKNVKGSAECLMGYAAMAAEAGLAASAARILAAAMVLGGRNTAPTWPATRMEYHHYLKRIRSQLSEAEFKAEQGIGRLLPMEEAVRYAQNLPLQAAAKRAPRKKKDPLTPREREVAQLIVQGKSNAEIAEELVLSKRTVETHVSNILRKLDFTSRSQIVGWYLENRLE